MFHTIELLPATGAQNHKIDCNDDEVDALFVDLLLKGGSGCGVSGPCRGRRELPLR